MNVRAYRDADLSAVVRIFTESVHQLTVGSYDAEEREAWAPLPPDTDHWQKRLKALETLVAESKEGLVGFVSFEGDGHIDLLYTAPAYARRGVATVLYTHAESALVARGVTELFTEASLVARPFFERCGFRVMEEQNVSVRGRSLRRYAMRKRTGAAQPGVPADGPRPAGSARR